MTYSQELTTRVRRVLAGRSGLTEKTMFGGIAFLLHGNMCVGVHGDDLIVRVDPPQTDALLGEPGARVFDLSGGRPMQGWLLVAPIGFQGDEALKTWVARGVRCASSLPKKAAKGKPAADSRSRR